MAHVLDARASLTASRAACGHIAMKIARIKELERPPGEDVFARVLLEGDQSNVRIIRFAAG
jgi:hypothetical protein